MTGCPQVLSQPHNRWQTHPAAHHVCGRPIGWQTETVAQRPERLNPLARPQTRHPGRARTDDPVDHVDFGAPVEYTQAANAERARKQNGTFTIVIRQPFTAELKKLSGLGANLARSGQPETVVLLTQVHVLIHRQREDASGAVR